jgi:hypothetical protein
MVKHIVIWKLKEAAANGAAKKENMEKFKELLMGLTGKIPCLLSAEVGLRTPLSPEGNDDIVLVSTFDTWADLDAYQVHPEHKKVVSFAKEVVEKRSALDYEI